MFIHSVRRAFSVVASTILLTSSAHAITVHPGNHDASYALAQQFGSVGYALPSFTGAEWDGSVSNTALGPSVVALSPTVAISAAHGSLFPPGIDYDLIQLGFGNAYEDFANGDLFTVTNVIRHPTLDLVIYDMSDDPVLNVDYANLHNSVLQIGDIIYGVGYGEFSEVAAPTSDIVWNGDKHAFNGIIETLGYGSFPSNYFFTPFARSTFNPFYTELGGAGNNGDSGGGVFIEMPDGSFELVGLMQVTTGGNDYSVRTGFLPLSDLEAREFIDSHLAATPEPSSALLLSTALLFGRSRTRKSR